jgi:tetratricopeptide (TPR) repeat protein
LTPSRMVLVVAAVLACAPLARAGKPASVEKLAADASAAYRAGDFARAADLLEKAYEAQPLSAILYNLAKAYEKLNENDKALDRYQRYVAADDADPRLRSKAEARIKALSPAPKPETASHKPETPANKPETPPPTVLIAPPVLAPPATKPLRVELSERERIRRRDRALAITFSIEGAVFLFIGVGLGVSAQSLHDEFASTVIESRKRQLASDAQAQAIAADVLYSIGGGMIAVSVYFYYRWLSAPAPKRAARDGGASWALVPWLAPSAAGVALGGRF